MLNQNILKLLSPNQLDILIQNNIIQQIDNDYILSSKYKIEFLQIKNNKAFITTKQDQTIYLDKQNLNGANHNDLVLLQMIFHPRKKIKAKVIKILQHNQDKILCYITKDKDGKNTIYSIKENIKLDLNLDISKLTNEDIFLVQNNQILKILGNLNDSKIDEIISLYLYHQEYRLENYHCNITQPISKDTNRIDLTNLPFCTIDPASAKDHDDAIYYDEKQNTLYVAIADVSSFIKDGSTLDIEAKKRAFSIYLPHKVLPMLPFELSNDLCSLKPNVTRLAFVIQMKLDIKNHSIQSYKIYEAIIKSQNKYSYDQIDEILEDKTKQTQEFQSIIQLYNITKKYRAKRLQKGYDFRVQELRLDLDDNLLLKDIKVEQSTPAHQLIEECMLLANIQAAKQLKLKGIYRIHEEPTLVKIDKLLEDLEQLGLKAKRKNNLHSTIESIQAKAKNLSIEDEVDRLIIQSMQQARYSSSVSEHFGLGFDTYSHFTSPIRRYSDLILLRILKTKTIPKDIEDITESISTKERSIASLVWDLEDRIYARWAKNNIGFKTVAKIIDTKTLLVEFVDHIKGAKAIIENYQGEALFSQIDVKITKVDLISKLINVKIIR